VDFPANFTMLLPPCQPKCTRLGFGEKRTELRRRYSASFPSAKKRIRQSIKLRARNRARKDLIKDQLKAFTVAAATGDPKKAEDALRKVASRLDKVASKGTIHKNTAAPPSAAAWPSGSTPFARLAPVPRPRKPDRGLNIAAVNSILNRHLDDWNRHSASGIRHAAAQTSVAAVRMRGAECFFSCHAFADCTQLSKWQKICREDAKGRRGFEVRLRDS